MKYFIHMLTGYCGSDGYDTFEADTEKEAEKIGWQMAVDNAEMYFDVIDENDIEDENDYDLGNGTITFQEIDYGFEEYNPKEHDRYF